MGEDFIDMKTSYLFSIYPFYLFVRDDNMGNGNNQSPY